MLYVVHIHHEACILPLPVSYSLPHYIVPAAYTTIYVCNVAIAIAYHPNLDAITSSQASTAITAYRAWPVLFICHPRMTSPTFRSDQTICICHYIYFCWLSYGLRITKLPLITYQKSPLASFELKASTYEYFLLISSFPPGASIESVVHCVLEHLPHQLYGDKQADKGLTVMENQEMQGGS